jgi:hypothetical protein
VNLLFDLMKHLVEVPFIPWMGPAAVQPVRIGLPEFRAALPDGLVGDHDAPREHHLLDLPKTEREPMIQLHTVTNDLRRISMALYSDDDMTPFKRVPPEDLYRKRITIRPNNLTVSAVEVV